MVDSSARRADGKAAEVRDNVGIGAEILGQIGLVDDIDQVT